MNKLTVKYFISVIEHLLNLFRHFSIILILLFFSNFYSQINIYVSDTNGSDSYTGLSESDPLKSINKAIEKVTPGDTILVMNGIYKNSGYGTVDVTTNSNMNNPHVVTINKSGTQGAYITLKNYPGHHPKIQFDGKGGIVISNDMNYIIVEGFEVEGPAASITYDQAIANRNYKIAVAEDNDDTTNYNHSYFSGKGIWGGYGAHHNIIIRNNIVHDTCGSGIRFNDSDHILIEYNEVFNTTWWTSSASSAVVFAESIASSEADNGTDIKMIMRGNVVYNNWNRIPFYVTQLPDNSGNTNPNYGTANYNNILDGQGLYVTRSDDNYKGTFLFENNVCVNNGKNGINFDNSLSASAIIQNNTIFFNGVHEIIQDNSVAEGNPGHRGQKVGGIKANKVANATVVNNIVVTRDNIFSAIELPNISGNRTVNNNIFMNGKLPSDDNGNVYNYISCCNMINIDPLFTSVPSEVNGAIDITETNFELTENSPAIDAGNPNYSPDTDINGNPRPTNLADVISYSSFENSSDGWTQFGGASLNISSDEALSGDKSLYITDREFNYSSPRLFLDGLLEPGETYTFYISVKLGQGFSGTSDITIKNTLNGVDTYTSLLDSPITVKDNEWTELSGNYTYTESDQIFVYIKGPTISSGGGNFYIDDFSLVPQGVSPVNFDNISDLPDIGAYEYDGTLNLFENFSSTKKDEMKLFPNPAKNNITLSNMIENSKILIYDILGKDHLVKNLRENTSTKTLDISHLKKGVYILKTVNNKQTKTKTFIKN